MHCGDRKINKTMYAAMHKEATKWLSGWVEEHRGRLSWKEIALVQAPVQMPKPVDEQCYWWPAPTVTSGYREVTLAGAFDTQDDERRLLHLLSFYMAASMHFHLPCGDKLIHPELELWQEMLWNVWGGEFVPCKPAASPRGRQAGALLLVRGKQISS